MKDPQSQYFGIRLVQLIGGGFPILRIQSGITSPHQAGWRFLNLPHTNYDNVRLRICVFRAMNGAMWSLKVASRQLQLPMCEHFGNLANKAGGIRM